MNWCCDCKNKYTNTKCDNCKSMSNFEKGDATVELLEKIKAEIKELTFLLDDLSPDKELVVDLDNIEEVINKHISELKGE